MSAPPDISLLPLFAPLTRLRGIGPGLAPLLARAVGGDRVIDLLFHLPDSYLDRRDRPRIADARPGSIATLEVEVVRHEPPANSRQPWKILVTDGSGFFDIVFFRFTRQAQMPPGARLLVSGKLESFSDRLTMPHPDHVLPVERQGEIPAVEPVWALTAGLWPRQVARSMAQALDRIPDLPEWHDAALLRREKWPDFAAAMRAVQAPETIPDATARNRLAYDELLAGQVAVHLIRGRARARIGRPLSGDGRLRAEAMARFGFEPTPSQRQALAEIDSDLVAPRRMLRLLQGDVGSGKTFVATMAMLRAAECGAQACLMAPTELLAKQHFRLLSRVCPVAVALLTGSVKGAARTRMLAGIADGSIPIVIGTHALFQEAVDYADLAVAVIDEQQRFGVDQRLSLGGKGERTDVLVMTATPIPRTLLLTQWGEMDISRLTEKPAGRLPIQTTLHSLATLPDIIDAVARMLERGGRIYWVCPMVSDNEVSDVAAAEARFVELRARFGATVGLAHGRQDAAIRDKALADFASGTICLLVATTVIEVGVDVPEAGVMVIDHAERFGLAQLHQLRGRVGRGTDKSFCLLLHDPGLNESARRRLIRLRDTEDGFLIADEDFRLRGSGDALGTRQSGLPGFRLADPIADEGLLHMAHRDAALLLAGDPKLDSDRGQAIRLLLRLFESREAMRTLLAG